MAEDLNIIGQLKFASQHLSNLILFCALLYYLLRKPVSTFFSSRSQKIKNEIEEASIIIDDAQKAYDANSDKLKLIDSEMSTIRNSIDTITNKKITEITENANFIANKTRKDTLDTIQLESIRLKSDIEYEVLNKSIELAQYEIKNDIDEEKDKVLISSFLQEVKQNVISNS